MKFKRVGGIVFWRVGKLGGSFFWSASKDNTEAKRLQRIKRARVRQAARFWYQYGAWLNGE